jgi:TRADD-N domain-containing protein
MDPFQLIIAAFPFSDWSLFDWLKITAPLVFLVFSAPLVDFFKSLAADKKFSEAQDRTFKEPLPLLGLSNLFELYSTQIDKYQAQTQGRATLSFLCAVVSMVAGISLLVWGGFAIVQHGVDKEETFWNSHILSGSIISVIGGAMSAFITKTFLDVHRTSLLQLNHYFKQPVLNSHILSAQRLSDSVPDMELRLKLYQTLIEQVIALIPAEQAQAVDLSFRQGSDLDRGAKGRKETIGKDSRAKDPRPARRAISSEHRVAEDPERWPVDDGQVSH